MKSIHKKIKDKEGDIKLILALAKDDFKIKFAGSYFGVLWGFVQPLITILLYWFVFEVGFKSGARPNGIPYILWLIAGIVPWFFFSEAWASATNCFYEYNFLVKKVVFPIWILPTVKITSSLFVHLFFIDILFICFAGYGYYLTIFNVQIIYYLICTIVVVYVFSLITSSIAVFLKDMNQIIGIFIQIFFWAIPIVWAPENFSGLVLRILKLNPIYYIVDGYRDSMINKIWFWQKPIYTCYFWIVVVLMFIIGKFIYKRLKGHFADVL
ncbi:MAG: ABC transporter permease [Velocimicrobium sp.]